MSLVNAIALLAIAANPFSDAFEKANAAYEAQDYAGAITRYEQLAADGVADPEVFFNLGNAYYRAGRLGPAIANYERALELDPGLERARTNLDHCLGRTKRNLGRPVQPAWEQALLFWHRGMSPATTRVLAIVAWVGLWALLALRQWRKLPYARIGIVLVALTAALLGFSAWAKAHPQPIAVAIEETVPVRYGTSDSETVRFELFEGDRVRIEDALDGWLLVSTVDDQRGWAREDQLLSVGPPYVAPKGAVQ